MSKYNPEVRRQFTNAQSADRRAIAAADPARLAFHLMPPVGWLNDPNGLCRFQGTTHIFFQYSPQSADGQSYRGWGHYVTKDYIHYQEENDPFVPDSEADANGSYSGSALVNDDGMHLFFTGNRKLKGDYDYINAGRTGWTLHSLSKDGRTFSEKEVVARNEEYPSDLSCHVRDPKVFKEGDQYRMVLGARTRNSQGEAIIMESPDLIHWNLLSRIRSQTPFGYMWECPDLFELDGHWLLICCPQGVERDRLEYQNVYQNGWFELPGKPDQDQLVSDFHTLDYGFDFYAPQTFVDENGRRILIGWMGMPDAGYSNPTVNCGWQHALTLPRKLFWKNGHLCSYPIEELHCLQDSRIDFTLSPGQPVCFETPQLEIHLEPEGDKWTLYFRHDCQIAWDGSILSLSLGQSGHGRTVRRMKLDRLERIDLFSDTSSLELFVNGGEKSMTTRLYDPVQEDSKTCLSSDTVIKGSAWTLGSFVIKEKTEKSDPTLYRERSQSDES